MSVHGALNELTLWSDDGSILSNAALMAASRESFGKWLQGVFGQVPRVGLGTYTFREPDIELSRTRSTIGQQYVRNAGRRLASLLEANGSTYFVCVEVGSDTRRLHLHSLETNELQTRSLIHMWWKKRFGFESYKVVSSLKGVSLYVTKYVTKSDMPFWAGGGLYYTFRGPTEGGPAAGDVVDT